MILAPAPLEAYLSSHPMILQANLHSSIFLAISELVSLFAIKTPDWLSPKSNIETSLGEHKSLHCTLTQ